jgi:hypothetical protein
VQHRNLFQDSNIPSPAGRREELLDPPDLGSTMAADRDVFLEN